MARPMSGSPPTETNQNEKLGGLAGFVWGSGFSCDDSVCCINYVKTHNYTKQALEREFL